MIYKIGDKVVSILQPEDVLAIVQIINPDTDYSTLICIPFGAELMFDYYYFSPSEVSLSTDYPHDSVRDSQTANEDDFEFGYVIIEGEGCRSYLTVGKKYPLTRGINNSNYFQITDDNGSSIYESLRGCDHLAEHDSEWKYFPPKSNIIECGVHHKSAFTICEQEGVVNKLPSDFVVNDKGGMKGDGTKVRPTILLKDLNYATNAVIRVLEYGAKKYSRNNYSLVEDDRYEDALARHYLSYLSGEELDDETGESHLAHIVCCAMFLLEKNKGE